MAVLLFFGRLQDLAHGGERSLGLSEALAIEDIVAMLGEADRLLGAALAEASVRYALNGLIVDGTALVEDDDELAFLPPVSGG